MFYTLDGSKTKANRSSFSLCLFHDMHNTLTGTKLKRNKWQSSQNLHQTKSIKIYQNLATTQEWTHSSWTCWLCCFFLVRVQVCAFNGFACSIFCWCLRRFGDSDVTQNTARHQHKQARNTCQISPNLLLHFLHLLVVFLWGMAFATATDSCLQARSYWGWIPTSQNPWWSFINTHTMSWTALTSHKRLDLDSQPCSRCVSLSLSLTLSLLL